MTFYEAKPGAVFSLEI